MKAWVFLTIISLVSISNAYSTVYTTISDGQWSNSSNWDSNGSPGTYWGAGDQVIILHDIDLNQNLGFAGSLQIQNGASLVGSNKSIDLYDGSNLNSDGTLNVKNLTLNAVSRCSHTSPLSISNHLTIGTNSIINSNAGLTIGNHFNNNGGEAFFNYDFTVNGNLNNNDGQITFQDDAYVGGNFQNNNSTANVNINNTFTLLGNFQNNSGGTVSVNVGATANLSGSFSNNTSSLVNIEGRLNNQGRFDNNGGTIQNNGIFKNEDNFTQNDGSFNNDGIMLIEGNLRVNGSGTIDGNGLIRANSITNYGSINGSNDICGLDDSSMPSQTGGGIYSENTSYCVESSSDALPITLDYFRLENNHNLISFCWQTLSEVNNDFFTVEFSKDAKTYETLLRENGAGNSSRAITYKRDMVNPYGLQGYYRLKQTDFDGKFSYSTPIFLKEEHDLPKLINAYPNPNNGSQLYLELEGVKAGQYVVGLLNNSGMLIIERKINIESSSLYFETELLHGSTIKPNTYYVRVSNDTDRYLKKILVK